MKRYYMANFGKKHGDWYSLKNKPYYDNLDELNHDIAVKIRGEAKTEDDFLDLMRTHEMFVEVYDSDITEEEFNANEELLEEYGDFLDYLTEGGAEMAGDSEGIRDLYYWKALIDKAGKLDVFCPGNIGLDRCEPFEPLFPDDWRRGRFFYQMLAEAEDRGVWLYEVSELLDVPYKTVASWRDGDEEPDEQTQKEIVVKLLEKYCKFAKFDKEKYIKG